MSVAGRAFRAAALGGLIGIGLGTAYSLVRLLAQTTTLAVAHSLIGAPLLAGFAAIFVLPAMLLVGWPLAALALAWRWSMPAAIAACVAAAASSLAGIVLALDLRGPGTMAGESWSVAATFVAAAIPFAICTAGGLAWTIERERKLTPPVPRSE